MSKVLSFRISDEEADWADGYVASRGCSRQQFLHQGFRSWREDCMSGVPDIVEPPKPKTPSQLERDAAVARAAEDKARAAMRAATMAHQDKLNAAKYGGS